ncbi:MAG: hypothetical protein ACK56F_12100 [bacterium]
MLHVLALMIFVFDLHVSSEVKLRSELPPALLAFGFLGLFLGHGLYRGINLDDRSVKFFKFACFIYKIIIYYGFLFLSMLDLFIRCLL